MKLKTTLFSAIVTVACAASVLVGGQAAAAPVVAKPASTPSASVIPVINLIDSIVTPKPASTPVSARVITPAAAPVVVHQTVTAPVQARAVAARPAATPAPAAEVAPKTAVAGPPGPTTRADRDAQALSKLGGNLGTGVGIGALVGTTIGAALGCVVGLVMGPFGCFGGFMTGAGFGGIVGTIAVGGPTLIGNAIDYFKTVNSPFVPPKQ